MGSYPIFSQSVIAAGMENAVSGNTSQKLSAEFNTPELWIAARLYIPWNLTDGWGR